MKTAYEKLNRYLERIKALENVQLLYDWDMETTMPEEAQYDASEDLGVLSEMLQEIYQKKHLADLIEQADQESLNEIAEAEIKKLKKNLYRMRAIPAAENRKFTELQATAAQIWAKAREEDDYASFAPVLKQMLDYTVRFAQYCRKEGEDTYDYLLNEYEEGFDTKTLDVFFAKLKKEILPVLKKQREQVSVQREKLLHRPVPIEKQREFNRFILQYIGFDLERGVLGESAHPFTGGARNDVRLTTHYFEDNPMSAVLSTIHEGGHGIYEQGMNEEVMRSYVYGGASCGMHESQSRFYENILGRSEAFWEPIYPLLTRTMGQWQDVPLSEFVSSLNCVGEEMRRTEADELSYSLHVMVRYELEKKLISGELSVEELPKEWNRLYEEYLGLKPKNDSEGVLQDIHWASGMFGYFPSYALGNAFAAQIYHKMKEDMDVDAVLRAGELYKIREYLGERIHQYGASRTSKKLLEDMTGEPFNPDYYIRYLKGKFDE